MRMVTSQGTLDGMQRIQIQGIVDSLGRCQAVKVIDLSDGEPISWGMSEKAQEDCRRIVEAASVVIP